MDQKELIWQPSFYAKGIHLDDHLKEFLSWKLTTPFWIRAKFYPEVTHLDDQLKELKELIWQQSFYAKMTHLDDHLNEFFVQKAANSLLDHSQVYTPRWLSWWPPEGATGAYMTAKFLRQDDPPWWPTERVSCPESWGLSSWSESSLYSEVTQNLMTNWRSLYDSQVSTPRWPTLTTTWKSFSSWKLRTPFLIRAESLIWGDPPWWTTEGAKGAYLTAKFLRQDDSPWWPPEGVSCPGSWRLPAGRLRKPAWGTAW